MTRTDEIEIYCFVRQYRYYRTSSINKCIKMLHKQPQYKNASAVRTIQKLLASIMKKISDRSSLKIKMTASHTNILHCIWLLRYLQVLYLLGLLI